MKQSLFPLLLVAVISWSSAAVAAPPSPLESGDSLESDDFRGAPVMAIGPRLRVTNAGDLRHGADPHGPGGPDDGHGQDSGSRSSCSVGAASAPSGLGLLVIAGLLRRRRWVRELPPARVPAGG